MPDRLPDLGRFRQRVTLQSSAASSDTPSPAGVPPQTDALTWTSVATYWAAVEPQRVRRSAGFDAPVAALWSLVTMRNPGVPVTTSHRLLLGSRILVIDTVRRIDELNEFLSIEVTENQSA